MPVSESSTVISLDDILAALELQLETEEAIDKLPLTHALEKCLSFAQIHNLNDLAQFVKQELEGYGDRSPSDRIVQLSYFDNGGQHISGLNQYRVYPLGTGVRKLEMHLKNGLTLILPKQILSFLSQTAGREVDSGHVSPSEIIRLLDKIRSLVSKRLKLVTIS